MTQKNFSIKEALKFAATSYIDNFVLILKLMLIWGLVFSLVGVSYIGLLSPFFGDLFWGWYKSPTTFDRQMFIDALNLITPGQWATIGIVSFLLYVAFVLIGIFFSFQLIRLGLLTYDKKVPTLSELFSFKDTKFFPFVGARLLYALKVMVGLIFFIIPGFYLLIKYLFAGYPLIDGAATSIKEDTTLTGTLSSSVMGKLFLAVFGIAILIGIFTGSNPPYFFLFFLSPFMNFVMVDIYKQLKKHSAPVA